MIMRITLMNAYRAARNQVITIRVNGRRLSHPPALVSTKESNIKEAKSHHIENVRQLL